METLLREYLDEMKKGIHARQQAQADMLDKLVLPKLDSIEAHVKETNGRVTELELKGAGYDAVCASIDKKNSNTKWFYLGGIIITAFLAALIHEYGLLAVFDVLKTSL